MGTVIQLKNQINNSYFQLKNSVENRLLLVEEKIKSKLASDVELVKKILNLREKIFNSEKLKEYSKVVCGVHQD